jgi:hypothetical protein
MQLPQKHAVPPFIPGSLPDAAFFVFSSIRLPTLFSASLTQLGVDQCLPTQEEDISASSASRLCEAPVCQSKAGAPMFDFLGSQLTRHPAGKERNCNTVF